MKLLALLLLAEFCSVSTQTVEWVDHCYTGSGIGYRGLQTLTASGHQCQTWASKTPHLHAYTPEGFPEAGLENNYCRNPDSDPNGPWCITQDPNVLWEYCALQRCASDVLQRYGELHTPNYPLGYYPSSTTLQWTLRSEGPRIQITFLDFDLEADGHCVYDSLKVYDGPDASSPLLLSACGGERPADVVSSGAALHVAFTSDATVESRGFWLSFVTVVDDTLPSTALYGQDCVFGSRGYRGTQGVTSSGKTCQAWSSQSPHRHQFVPSNYTEADLSLGYCRNPDGDLAGPWCYTTDSATRWQYCGITHCKTCGRSYYKPVFASTDLGRIVGGEFSHPNSWPWMASLRPGKNYRSGICGASLIHPRWILTAAHCIRKNADGSLPDFHAVLGLADAEAAFGDSADEQWLQVERLHVHEQYGLGEGFVPNDLALLRTREPARLDDKVNLICLPSRGERLPDDYTMILTGYGMDSATGVPPALKQARMKHISLDRCLGLLGSNVRASGGHICAGYVEGGADACNGDSGGPLVAPRGDKWALFGLVSWGMACGTAPGVYTEISHYTDWIREKMGSDWNDAVLCNPWLGL
ncbi:unnamed protein product [Lampetra fluviatilis]